jgi:hypothetical protein
MRRAESGPTETILPKSPFAPAELRKDVDELCAEPLTELAHLGHQAAPDERDDEGSRGLDDPDGVQAVVGTRSSVRPSAAEHCLWKL